MRKHEVFTTKCSHVCMRHLNHEVIAFHMIQVSHDQHLVIHLYAEHVSCNDLSFILQLYNIISLSTSLSFTMDVNRFAEFQVAFFEVYNFLKENDGKGQVEGAFNSLVERFF